MATSKLTSRLNRLEVIHRQRMMEGPLLCECVGFQVVQDGEPFERTCSQCGRAILTIIEQVVNSREELELVRLRNKELLASSRPS